MTPLHDMLGNVAIRNVEYAFVFDISNIRELTFSNIPLRKSVE